MTAFANSNGKDKCVANQGETFTGQPAYTLDNTAPTASGVLSPAPNAAGWSRSDVTITWTGADTGGSGVKSVDPGHGHRDHGRHRHQTATVTDNVGNTVTSAPVTVKLDKTAPTHHRLPHPSGQRQRVEQHRRHRFVHTDRRHFGRQVFLRPRRR